jgi:hypothetical protein
MHKILIPFTHLWAMSNFYFSNGNLYFFIDSVRVFFSLITKFPRKKGKYVTSKLDGGPRFTRVLN